MINADVKLPHLPILFSSQAHLHMWNIQNDGVNTMVKLRWLLITCLLLLLQVNTVYSQWIQTHGPYGAEVSCFAMSDNSLFAGTGFWGQGVFISKNNGTNWTAVNNGLTNYNIHALVIKGTTLLAATEGGVFLSTNSGVNWTGANKGLSNTYINSLVISSTNLFAGTEGGVYLSTDNGKNWTPAGLNNENIRTLAVMGTELFAGTFFHGVFLSTDNGVNWKPVNNGLAANMLVFTLAVSGTNLFAGTINGAFLSIDHGSSWTKAGLKDEQVISLTASGKNLYAGTHTVQGFLGGIINGGIHLSTDKGNSWIDLGFSETNVNSILVSGTRLFAGTNTGVYLTENFSISWDLVNKGLWSSCTVLAPSDTRLFAGTAFFGVQLSADNGASWAPTGRQEDLLYGYIYALAVIGTDQFAGTGSGGVFRSTNNGTSWKRINEGMPDFCTTHVFVKSGNTLFAGANEGVFRSTNNGDNWTSVNTGLNDAHVKVLAFSGTNLFAGTEENGIFVSTDNGDKWTPANSGLTDSRISSLAVSGAKLFAGTGGGVFLSTNDGARWKQVNNGLTDKFVLALAVSGTNLFAGTYSGVFLSTNDGTNWKTVNTGLTNKNIVALAVKGDNLFAGTSQGVWRRPLTEMITDVEEFHAALPERYSLEQNYPNPFNPVTRIRFAVPARCFVSLTVHDLLGRKVAELVREVLTPGTHETTFDGTDLASGQYYCRLQVRNISNRQSVDYIATKKMMLIR
jgi:photosystem II stability/assembly factor-like uncharacterized protein